MLRSQAAAVVVGWLALSRLASAADWVELKTDGFTVYGDDGEKAARKVAARLEALRGFLRTEWPWARFVPEVPVVVVALEGQKQFGLLLPAAFAGRAAQTAGVTFLEQHRTLVLLHGEVPEDPTGDNPHHAVFHEYVHTILGRTMPLPTWLNEGLAEYWGSTKIKQREVEFGRPIGRHVGALRARSSLSLETLFQVDSSSIHYNEADRSTVFYAQSWALVHYLALAAPARKGQLNRLFTLLAQGREEMEATREVLGDFGALKKELEAYVSRRSMRYEAEAKLREAIRLNPRFASAYTALAAVLAERGGSRTEALQLLEEGISLNRSSAVVRIGAAEVLFRLGEMDLARTYARAAVRLAPNARSKAQAAELVRRLDSAQAGVRP
jgi:hypothetical protein